MFCYRCVSADSEGVMDFSFSLPGALRETSERNWAKVAGSGLGGVGGRSDSGGGAASREAKESAMVLCQLVEPKALMYSCWERARTCARVWPR